MLISCILFCAYSAFSPSPQRPEERKQVLPMGAFVETGKEIALELDLEFVSALKGMRAQLETDRSAKISTSEALKRSILEKKKTEEELETAKKKAKELEASCELKDGQVTVISQQVENLTRKLEDIELVCQDLSSKYDRTAESLERHKQEEERLEGELKKRKQELKKSKVLARIATRQNAVDVVTTETFLQEIKVFLAQLKEIIKVYEETGTDHQVLTRAVEAFEKNNDFIDLSESIKADYVQGNSEIVESVNAKKERIRETLFKIASQIE